MSQNIEMTWRMVNMTADEIIAFNEMQQAINETAIQNFQAKLWANAIQFDAQVAE